MVIGTPAEANGVEIINGVEIFSNARENVEESEEEEEDDVEQAIDELLEELEEFEYEEDIK